MKPSNRSSNGYPQNSQPPRSPSLPNVIVHKAKHIIPVRDAIKYTLYNGSGQTSPSKNSQKIEDTSFDSINSPPKHSPPPPPITSSNKINSNLGPTAHSNPIYQSITSQLSHQNNQSISLNRLMSHPYFRSHHLLNNSVRRSANEKKSLSNSFTNSNSAPDQVDHSTNSTLKSYLSDRNVSNSNPTTQNNSSPNKPRTLPTHQSSRRSRRSQKSSKRLTEDQLRQKLAQYEFYIASQLDKVDSNEKKTSLDKKPTMTDEQWQELVFNRIFLGANSVLLLCAFIMLALACILDPNPIHKLNSKGGFYAFNSVVFIFLSLLGLYGIRPLRKKLLLTYASCIGFLLIFRLITGLVMLIALENNQSELIFLLSAGLIEMVLAILALANAFNTDIDKFPSTIDSSLPGPIQVLCNDDNKKLDSNKTDEKQISKTDNSKLPGFDKNSILRKSMNVNNSSSYKQPIRSNDLVTGIQTTAGELIYVSPDNLIFNERSVDAPAVPKKLEQRNSNYATNLSQYSTIGDQIKQKNEKDTNKKTKNNEIITKTTIVAKPFQLNKELLKPEIKTKPKEKDLDKNVQYSTINFISKPNEEKKVNNTSKSNTLTKPGHRRQNSSNFLNNSTIPYRTSTPSSTNLPPPINNFNLNYSPQGTTSSIGTSKTSIFDYNYSPINLNQISHHIINNQKPTTSKNDKVTTNNNIAITRQNILINKMNFLNNNSDYSDQYKQNIINQVVNETKDEKNSKSSKWLQ